jgi:phosphocarrier protein HPr
MKQFQYTIKDELGVHARPAGLLVKLAKQYTSAITIDKNGKTGNSAKSEIIRKFKKVCSECNKKRAECKHKEMF